MSARAKSTPCEIRSERYRLFTLKIHSADLGAVQQHLADHVAQAAGLFADASVVIEPVDVAFEDAAWLDLFARVRTVGLNPLAVSAQPSSALLQQLQNLSLPVLQVEADAQRPSTAVEAEPTESAAPKAESVSPVPVDAGVGPLAGARIETAMVRSGQRVYARDADLVLLGPVSQGAEVIADGNIYAFHRMYGRALAGASGNEQAEIFCSNFGAELVSIAGTYRLLESVDAKLAGKAVRVRLLGEKLEMIGLS